MALLEQQQQFVVERNAEGIQTVAERIDENPPFLRMQGFSIRKSIAGTELGRHHEFHQIVPKLPVTISRWSRNTVEENNHSIMRIGRIAKQNHMLLSRSIEMVNADTPTSAQM